MRMSGISGSENHLGTLVPRLARQGWVIDVLIPSPRPNDVVILTYAERLRPDCRRVDVLPMPRDLSYQLLRALAGRMRAGDVSLVHTHLVHADWHAALAGAVAPGVRLISTKHNHDRFRERPVVAAAERVAAARFDATLAISESLRRFLKRHSGTDATTVLYGLDPGPLPAPGARDPLALLAVGRLEAQKGHDVLLEAMPAILARHPGAHLSIAGEGVGRPALTDQIRRLGLESRVTLLGARGDVQALMARSGVLVHPSRWEGFGLVLLEAMATGLPIVASGVGGVPEVVADRVTGRLVAPEDPVGLASAVGDLLSDPAEAAELGTAGRQRLIEVFDPDRMARETTEVYRALLA